MGGLLAHQAFEKRQDWMKQCLGITTYHLLFLLPLSPPGRGRPVLKAAGAV